ncbi:MAG: acyltransferase, partial [Actinobacteria bacterium]|nr:acyltransferase [Actinomycetota bacterium]
MHALTASPADLVAATPADRDRYLDVLRGFALTVVVLGHWLQAVVWLDDGVLRASNILSLAPASRWSTWLLQVMPLFFLVGGVVNARSWRATRDAGGTYVAWVGRRAARLLRPTTLLVWVWVTVAAVALAAGVERSLILLGARGALTPLWFLGVYLLLIAGVPVLLAAYDRYGLALVAALLLLAVAIDVTVRAGVTLVGFT